MLEGQMLERIQRVFDRIESRWALGLLIAGTGVLSGSIADATAWLNAWGPIAWWGAFLVGAMTAACTLFLVSMASSKWLHAKEINQILRQTGINPLEDRFERKAIDINAFFNRDYVEHINKSFKECYLSGPAMVLMGGCTIERVDFRGGCQIVIVPEGSTACGIVAFQRCLFSGGVMSNITLVMIKNDYDSFPDELKKHIPVISGL